MNVLQRLYSIKFIRSVYHKNKFFEKVFKVFTENQLLKKYYSGKVLNGPFKGMNYPFTKAICSSFFPKIAGSYESELHPTLLDLEKIKFEYIIDIGCAEGYYVNGLALKFPDAQVDAYDIEEVALKACNTMALANNIGPRIKYFNEFNTTSFSKYNNAIALYICDCEGYELQIFQEDTIQYLNNAYLIIECHDFIHRGIRVRLEELFNVSHNSYIVKSLDDFEKIRTYQFVKGKLTNIQKWYLYAERRPEIMEWLVLSPKNNI